MFRPFRNRQNWRAIFSPDQLATAMKANQGLSSGHAGEAAPLFAQLAQEMENSHHPRRAANLHAQAALAYADSQNEQSALGQSRGALSLFVQYQMAERTSLYGNITRKMSQKGMSMAAETLHKEYGGLVGPIPASLPQAQAARRGALPPACTQCGAPLRSDEVDWVDDQTVECGYCGGLIKTTRD